jgi:hypothetical protein
VNALSRRLWLRGGGACLALPLLESVGRAKSSPDREAPYAIFFRQACGVASEQTTSEIGPEPERFWPRGMGKLSPETLSGRALEELSRHTGHLLVVKGVNMTDFDYADGHARGALQGLTARGPVVPKAGGNSEAAGESIDHRIGRELNPGGRDSLFQYVGPSGGWLGGACISYRGPGERRAPIRRPRQAYELVTGGAAQISDAQFTEKANEAKSVNDLIRTQMQALLGRTELSVADRQRLDLHFSAIRDLERSICRLPTEGEKRLLEGASYEESTRGEDVMRLTRLHMDVAVLAVACGFTRSVAIQIGNGNDGSSCYLDPKTGKRMENYHFVSHRRRSHDGSGDVIDGSDLLHHQVDRYFAQSFGYLLDRLSERTNADGSSLLDAGVSVWYNDHGDGPAHGTNNCPFVLAGSAGGFFKQSACIRLNSGGANHQRMLNTIGSAVGLRNGAGEHLDDFGDPGLSKGLLPELMRTA